jgi:hypothetical protein
MLLNIPNENIKSYLAGECWEDGMFTMERAQALGYGVLFESGSDVPRYNQVPGEMCSIIDSFGNPPTKLCSIYSCPFATNTLPPSTHKDRPLTYA